MFFSPMVVEKIDVELLDATIPLYNDDVDVVELMMVLPEMVMSLAPFRRKPLLFGVYMNKSSKFIYFAPSRTKAASVPAVIVSLTVAPPLNVIVF